MIAIIGILASAVLASLNDAREQANYTKSIQDMRALRNNWRSITTIPRRSHLAGADCDASTDPFLNALGVSRWNGPYGSV